MNTSVKRGGSKHPQRDSAPDEMTFEELVAGALNEQGFLFQQKVAHVLRTASQKPVMERQHKWRFEAVEVPVSLPDGQETRIDLVLRYGDQDPCFWWVVVECKRALPDYKAWVFFGEPQGEGQAFVETVALSGSVSGNNPVPWLHHVLPTRLYQDAHIYQFGVECKVARSKAPRMSATDAIEGAMQQVTLSQAGLAIRLKRARLLNFQMLPVVVTTANLYSSDIDPGNISLERGAIDPKQLKLKPREWLAVNYSINDSVGEQGGVNTNRSNNVGDELRSRQIRTVFVVQAANLESFLAWLEKRFVQKS
jgi:hypothetical protein